MKRLGYLWGWALLGFPLLSCAADGESNRVEALKKTLWVVKYVRNGGTKNPLNIALRGCLDTEKDRNSIESYVALVTCLLARPVKTGLLKLDETMETTVNWLIPSINDATYKAWASWVGTHHSTVCPFIEGQEILMRRFKGDEQTVDEEPLFILTEEQLRNETVVEFRWTVYTDGEHLLTPISAEDSNYVIPKSCKNKQRMKLRAYALNMGPQHPNNTWAHDDEYSFDPAGGQPSAPVKAYQPQY